MPVYREEPVVERQIVQEPVVERQVVRDEPAGGMTGYALVKYGFILAITIVILYFLARYVLPLVR